MVAVAVVCSWKKCSFSAVAVAAADSSSLQVVVARRQTWLLAAV
jgi:hypothetical protein